MQRARSFLPITSIAYFGFIVIGLLTGAIGVLLPSMISDYHVNKSIIGLLLMISSLGYFLSAMYSGTLAQKLGTYRYVALCALIMLISCLLIALRLPFIGLILADSALSFGMGGIDAGVNNIVVTLPNSSGRLNALHGYFGVGALLGPLIASSLLTLHWAWQQIFLIWAGLSFLLLLGGLLLARKMPQPRVEQQEEQKPQNNVLALALRTGMVWLGMLFLFVYVGIEGSVGTWNYSFSLESGHLDPLLAGWIASGYWLGLTAGRFLVNPLRSWLHFSTATLIYGCLTGIALGLVLVWLLSGPLAIFAGFILIGLFLGPIFPAMIGVMPKLVSAELAASAIGLLVGTGVIGGALFPLVTATLAQAFGIWMLLPTILVLTIVMYPLWWRLIRNQQH